MRKPGPASKKLLEKAAAVPIKERLVWQGKIVPNSAAMACPDCGRPTVKLVPIADTRWKNYQCIACPRKGYQR